MVREFTDIRQASSAAVTYIIDVARSAVADKGFCTIVLSGGSTPQLMYKLLSGTAYAKKMVWQQSHFFWGDERWVAAAHPYSNFAMVEKALLSKVRIPPRNVHRIATDHSKPEISAALYEKHLRDFFTAKYRTEMRNAADIAVAGFDLILLGMGSDGHTASLFPGSALLSEKKKWVAAVPEGVGAPPVARITLTLPVLNQAKNVLFLIAGATKRKILETILTEPAKAAKLYPAARIKPAGNIVWMSAETTDPDI